MHTLGSSTEDPRTGLERKHLNVRYDVAKQPWKFSPYNSVQSNISMPRCWSALKSGLSADEIASAHDVMLERMDAEFGTLKRLEALVAAAEATFPAAASAKEMDPAATTDAVTAEAEAAENAQVLTMSILKQSMQFSYLC